MYHCALFLASMHAANRSDDEKQPQQKPKIVRFKSEENVALIVTSKQSNLQNCFFFLKRAKSVSNIPNNREHFKKKKKSSDL